MTQNLEAIRRFILGGIAIFTIVSKKSGDRKTFRVRAAEDVDGSGKPHGYYVDLLTGPNNTEDYTYLCYLWFDRYGEFALKLNPRKWAEDAYRTFGWFTLQIDRFMHGKEHTGSVAVQRHFESQAEFHHAGLCSRCGRTLTEPESIELGIGPVCRGKG